MPDLRTDRKPKAIGPGAIAVCVVILSGVAFNVHTGFVAPAYAETHDTDTHHDGGHETGGHETDDHETDGHEEGSGGTGKAGAGKFLYGQGTGSEGSAQGQGSTGAGSGGQGPHAGSAGSAGGSRPAWAQEGIPEVELGRLNVVRSPDRVLDRAYLEALASFTPEMADFYNLSVEQAAEQLSLHFDDVNYIDSPLQNLALLKDALDGSSVMNTTPAAGVSNSEETLMAIFLGVASDKTITISAETAYAVSKILGYELTQAQATALAADAEAIRVAVLAGHG